MKVPGYKVRGLWFEEVGLVQACIPWKRHCGRHCSSGSGGGKEGLSWTQPSSEVLLEQVGL